LIERLAELLLLVLVGVPVARVAADPGLRRRFAAFPPLQLLLPAALAGYALLLAGTFFYAPMLLRFGAALAAVAIVYDLVQRRPQFGARRRLPRGSLGFFPAGPWRDPEYFRKNAHRWGSIFKFRHLSRPAVAIVGLDSISDFLQSQSENLSSPPAPFNAIIEGGFVRYLSGGQHLDAAVVLRSAMSRQVIADRAAEVIPDVRATLDAVAADPRGVPREIDRLMLHVMLHCFLGLDGGPERDRIAGLYAVADYRSLARTGKRNARRALGGIIEAMRRLSERKDQPSSFLAELARVHPHALSSDGMMANFAYALHTARVDTAGLVVWVLALAGENPCWITRLRGECAQNPDAGETGGLADRIVRESLRLRQSEFIIRRAMKDVEFGGYTIPEGWHVRLCVAESHRSSLAFADADRFDPDRFLKTPARQRYAPFGFAPHLCPGEHLTRWIGRMLLVELARSFEIRSRDVEPWEFGGFHWRPNSRMTVALTPVT
jgi:cytochrome P450